MKECIAFVTPTIPRQRFSRATRNSTTTMRLSAPNVSRRAVLALLLSLPVSVSAKVLVADPDALSRVVKTQSGLQYFDITNPSTGSEVTPTSVVTLHYTLGTTGARNGWRIDSSNERDPFTFQVGKRDVIAGLEEGVQGMRAGGVRRLLIPPELGYRSEKDRPIPPGFAEYQRFKNVYLNKDRVYSPDVVMDVTVLKVR